MRYAFAAISLLAPFTSAQAGGFDDEAIRAVLGASVGGGRPGAMLVVVQGDGVLFAEAAAAS